MSTMSMPTFRYRRLGYAALNVTDLGRSRDFYRRIVGLTEVCEDQGVTFFRCSEAHHALLLCEGTTPGLKRIGWQIEDEAHLVLAFDHFVRAGLAPRWLDEEETRLLRQGRSFRLREPSTGLSFEYYAQILEMTQPVAPASVATQRKHTRN